MKMKSSRTTPPLRIAAALLLLLLPCTVGATPASAPPVSTLWSEAVAGAARSAGYLPGAVYTDVTVTDARGDLKSSQRTWSRLSVTTNGKVVTTVVRATKNGRDDTANTQAQLDRNPERSRFDSSLLPMMPSNQGRVDVTPTGLTRTIGAIPCAGFSFRMRGKGGRATEGTVWLDERNGSPVLLEFTFAPLPTGAKVVRNTLHFAAMPGGAWRLTSLDTYAEGRLLFFERIFKLHMEFSDYFPYAP